MLTRLAWIHDLVPKSFWRSSDWLMRSELGYFAHSLISGLKWRRSDFNGKAARYSSSVRLLIKNLSHSSQVCFIFIKDLLSQKLGNASKIQHNPTISVTSPVSFRADDNTHDCNFPSYVLFSIPSSFVKNYHKLVIPRLHIHKWLAFSEVEISTARS